MINRRRNFTQLRLLLDPSWIQELDTLARAKSISRLALIRYLLRSQMDEELDSYKEFVRAREDRGKTRRSLEDYLNHKVY
jgi:hypothetical protein